MTDESPTPHVIQGHILSLRLFDIAYAIDLTKAEALWAQHAAGRTSRARLTTTPPKAIAFGVEPLELALDAIVLDLAGETIEAMVTARLYDFGTISLALRVPAREISWELFTARLNAVGAVARSRFWAPILDQLREILREALIKPTPSAVSEDYLIGTVQSFDAPLLAADILRRLDLVPLLSGETRQLSDGARADLLRQRFSYYADDLAVLTWDRAFVVEPRGDSDVADVLEVANAQLLQMRHYDELLDDELPRMYDMVESARSRWNLGTARRYANLARTLTTLVAEVTELTEKVDNALQVTEDVYLARVYTAALELFRVPNFSRAVDRKLAIIRDTYTALYDEASSLRSTLMEAAVILLILIEIGLALTGR
jgi:hypothetical protein